MEVTLYQGLIEFNWNLLFSMITVFILYLILKHFFFEKVHNFMVQREESVIKTLADADNKNKEAELKLSNYNTRISALEEDGRKIVGDAKKRADNVSDKIVTEATTLAASIVNNAEEEAERRKEDAEKEMRNDIAKLAVLAAEKIIETEIDDKKQDEIVDGILERAGKTQWQD